MLNSAVLVVSKKFLPMFGKHTLFIPKKNNWRVTLSALKSSDCKFASLILEDSIVNNSDQVIETYLNAYRKFGIQAICRKVLLDIRNSSFTKGFTFITSFDLSFTAWSSVFHGNPAGISLPTCVTIYLFSSCYTMDLQNVTVSHLKYKDLITPLVLARYYYLAALSISTFEVGYNSSHDICSGFGTIEIFNSSFISNHRALSVGLSSRNDSALVRKSVFVDNESDGDGAGIFIRSPEGSNGSVTIQDCRFQNNRAGVIPFKHTQPNCTQNKRIVSDLQIRNCKTTSEHILMLEVCVFHDVASDECEVKTAHLDVSGSGGAIYARSGHLSVLDSFFWNNSAENEGGAIVSTNSSFLVANSEFHGPFSDPGDSMAVAIFSTGTLDADNITFYVHHGFLKNLFVHDNYKLENSAKLSNIILQCPQSSFVKHLNSSRNLFRNDDQDSAGHRHVMELVRFGCKPCKETQYSLESGHYNLSTHLSLKEIQCFECPYGGWCNTAEGVLSEPNFWGQATNGQVEFYVCPSGYCCSSSRCPGYNICESHRTGTLCGRCAPGYAESMLSTKCMPNHECSPLKFIFSVTGTMLIYIMFLTFHKDIKDFLFKSAKSGQCKRRAQVAEVQVSSATKHSDKSTQTNSNCKHDEGVIFLLLICCYFQDTAIVVLDGAYTQADSGFDKIMKKVISNVFSLKFNFMDYSKDICIHDDFPPVAKQWVGIFHMTVLFFAMAASLYVCHRLILRYPHHLFIRKLSEKLVVGFTMSILLANQTVVILFFNLVNCTQVGNKSVLLLDGNVQCFTWWQWVCIGIIVVNILPFSIFLVFIPKHLKRSRITIPEFFWGCFLPFLFTSKYLVDRCTSSKQMQNSSAPRYSTQKGKREVCVSHCGVIYEMLQGPYKETQEHFFQLKTYFCWTGVLFFRRLVLVSIHTFVQSQLLKMCLMSLLMFLYMIDTIYVKPCNGVISNMADVFSSSALVLLCVINLMKATFQTVQFNVDDIRIRNILKAMFYVEDALTFIIPLIVSFFILLLVVYKLLLFVCEKCKQRMTTR